ncbi:uncharacterized protein CEXT_266991, partial [Caerostris extrusa]
ATHCCSIKQRDHHTEELRVLIEKCQAGKFITDVGVLEVCGESLQGQVDVEGEGDREVNDVDGPLGELQLAGAGDEADRDLEGEPGVAGALDEKEASCGLVHLVQGPGHGARGGVQHRHVADDGARACGGASSGRRQDGHADEEHRHHADDLQRKKKKLAYV